MTTKLAIQNDAAFGVATAGLMCSGNPERRRKADRRAAVASRGARGLRGVALITVLLVAPGLSNARLARESAAWQSREPTAAEPTQLETPRGTCTGTPITQSVEPNIIAGPSVWCGNQATSAETSLARSFVAAESTTIRCIRFGITENWDPPWTVYVRVLQGSIAGPYANLTLLAETPVVIPSGIAQEFFDADMVALPISAGVEYVVELRVPSRYPPEGGDGGLLALGCNGLGETAPTYIRAPLCGVTDFLPLSSIGFGNRHLVLTLIESADEGQVCGAKWNDLNNNGVRDSGEPGIPGWTIVVTDSQVSRLVTTGANGEYCVTVAAGAVTVGEQLQPGWIQTSPASGEYQVVVAPNAITLGLDFGNHDVNPCPPQDVALILDTGSSLESLVVGGDLNIIDITDLMSVFLAPRMPNPKWQVVCDPDPTTVEPRPAVCVPAFSGWWPATLGTQWISSTYAAGDGTTDAPYGEYCFRLCFCLDPRFSNPILDLNLCADDGARVYLNGVDISGALTSTASGPPVNVQATYAPLFHAGENCIEIRVNNANSGPVGMWVTGTVTAENGRCCCPTTDLGDNLTTAVDENDPSGPTLIGIGDDDDDWEVVLAPNGTLPRPAVAVISTAGWQTCPNSRWISANNAPAGYGPSGEYRYRHCFCLDPRFQSVTLTLTVRVDDTGAVLLNGTQVGIASTFGAANPPTITVTDITHPGLFQPGENCLEIVVNNTDVSPNTPTGINVCGSIIAPGGACCAKDDCARPPRKMVGWWTFDETAGTMAYDIAGAPDDGTLAILGPPANAGTGAVADAQAFGPASGVTAPDAAPFELNFGPSTPGTPDGDFSIDAWIYLQGYNPVLAPIVDKRRDANDQVLNGYFFYLYDGILSLEIADGPGVGLYTGQPVPLATWAHVAVTVDRDDPTGVVFYLNGSPVIGGNPTPRSGSLANSGSTLIGLSHPYGSSFYGAGVFRFPGLIDELEIFSRELRASEVMRIHLAGSHGKCKEFCSVPAVSSYNLAVGENFINIPVTVCNNSTATQVYTFTARAVPAGPTCQVAGPPAFTLPPGPLVVPAGGCVTVQIGVQKPLGFTSAGITACWEFEFTNQASGEVHHCHGGLEATEYLSNDPNSGGLSGIIPIPANQTATVQFAIRNTTADWLSAGYALQVVAPDREEGPSPYALNDLAPGFPVTGQTPIGPGASADVGATVRVVEYSDFAPADVVLLMDTDGDGDYEPVASATVYATPASPALCPGDVNCDGIVDFFDIDYFVAALGYPGGVGWPYANCPWANADADGDGDVDFFDIDPFVALLGQTCP